MRLFAAYRDWRPSPLFLGSTIFTAAWLVAAIIASDLAHWAATAISANVLLLTAVGLWPRSTWLGPNWTNLPPAAARRGEIAITIDDGPNPAVTSAVLDILERYQAKATFFCIAENALRYPDLCREITARGHAVENHTFRHRHNFSLLMPNGFFSEINAAQEALSVITGVRPNFFRAPAGLRNPLLDPVLSRLGLQLASWTRRGFDTIQRDPHVVLAKLLAGLKAGDILLLHDGNAALTAAGVPVILEVLPALLEAIAKANLHTVTLSEANI